MIVMELNEIFNDAESINVYNVGEKTSYSRVKYIRCLLFQRDAAALFHQVRQVRTLLCLCLLQNRF